MNPPDWLTTRGGSLKLGSDGKTWFVIFNGRPDYSVVATPVSGKFGCTIRQTVNGNRMDSATIADSKDAAVRAGLEELGKMLGWV